MADHVMPHQDTCDTAHLQDLVACRVQELHQGQAKALIARKVRIRCVHGMQMGGRGMETWGHIVGLRIREYWSTKWTTSIAWEWGAQKGGWEHVVGGTEGGSEACHGDSELEGA